MPCLKQCLVGLLPKTSFAFFAQPRECAFHSSDCLDKAQQLLEC